MSGVPIYTESPISPAKAIAITPQTAGVSRSPYTPATTTSAATSSTPAYGPPHSATELPTPTLVDPTPAVAPSIPPTPTSTTATYTNPSPPPPQPGALPTPFVPKSRTPSPRREIPPPPKTGEKVQPPSYYSPAPTPNYFTSPQPFPPQMNFSPPTAPRSAGIPPASTTSAQPYQQQNGSYTPVTANGLLSPQSARLPYSQPSYVSQAQTPTSADPVRQSFEHPPGYVQNPYAADLTPEQRFATAHSPGSPSLGWNSSGPAKSPGILGTSVGLGGLSNPAGGLGGILNGGGGGSEESVWGVVGGWVKGVGKKIGEMEENVWKKINGGEE